MVSDERLNGMKRKGKETIEKRERVHNEGSFSKMETQHNNNNTTQSTRV